MVILTNGLTDKTDEGFLKIANNLIKRLKEVNDTVKVVSYERQSELTDEFIKANKFMSNKAVRKVCEQDGDVLYVPFPTKKWVMATRVFLLSHFTKRLRVVLVLKTPVSIFSKLLLKMSKVEIIVFSRDAADFYETIVGKERVSYLKTGVDMQKFTPVSSEEAKCLKIKYGFDPNKKIVLHVGHLNEGRNIRELMKINSDYQVLLVTSTLTANEADHKLKNDLLAKENVRIIDNYICNIEEIYQLSDVYFFPVTESGHCVDIPLSCLEAAACGTPVITTAYEEMKELLGREGFYFLKSFDAETINTIISDALDEEKLSASSVAEYDWNHAVSFLSCL